jgi:hypothetical protein
VIYLLMTTLRRRTPTINLDYRRPKNAPSSLNGRRGFLFQPPILLVACGKVNKRNDYQNNSGGAGVCQNPHA